MRIISRSTLRSFWENHPDSAQPLKSWVFNAERSEWRRPADIKQAYATASFVGARRVVFNIAGNKYRLVAAVHYDRAILYIRFIGSHAAYDRIDASEV